MRPVRRRAGDRSGGHRGTRRSRALLLVLAAMAGVIGLVPGTPAAPAEAVSPRPVLFVCGFGCEQRHYAGFEAWLEARGYSVYSVSLAEDPRYLWPGTASNGNQLVSDPETDSSDRVAEEMGDIRAAHPGQKVDMVGFSEGILPIRHYVWHLTDTSHVGAVISLEGINQGVTTGVAFGVACDWLLLVPACHEIVWEDEPGDTDWLEQLNCTWPWGCDPTPGSIRYYHIYTPHPEAAGLWSTIPGDGVRVRGTHEDCPALEVPHVVMDWSTWEPTRTFLDYEVTRELLVDALEWSDVLDAPEASCRLSS